MRKDKALAVLAIVVLALLLSLTGKVVVGIGAFFYAAGLIIDETKSRRHKLLQTSLFVLAVICWLGSGFADLRSIYRSP